MLLCVHLSLSLCVCTRALVHVSACIFIVHAWPGRGSCFRLQLVRPRNRSRILARGELGLQVAYGAGLGGK